MQLPVLNGSYQLDLPISFFPDYSKHGLQKTDFNYEFSYEAHIQAKNKITSISLPQFAQITEQNETGTEIKIQCNRRGRQMALYYKTKDMLSPQLYYVENAAKEEVACIASLVPTFEPPAP